MRDKEARKLIFIPISAAFIQVQYYLLLFKMEILEVYVNPDPFDSD